MAAARRRETAPASPPPPPRRYCALATHIRNSTQPAESMFTIQLLSEPISHARVCRPTLLDDRSCYVLGRRHSNRRWTFLCASVTRLIGYARGQMNLICSMTRSTSTPAELRS